MTRTSSEQGAPSARRRVVVTGVGTISPFGDRPGDIHRALAAGRTAFKKVGLFPTEKAKTDLAAEIELDPKHYLEGNIRPIDRTGRLSIIAAKLALEASGWTDEMRRDREVSLVLGTMFGSVRTIAEFDRRALEAGPKYAKPFEFANSVINAAAGQTAIWHGLTGVNSTVAGGASAGLQAIAYAADMIRGGRSEVVLAGGAEELCFESFYGYSRTGLLAGSSNGAAECAIPFERRRNGFRLGEGAALLVLEEAEAAERRGAVALAEIRGYANAFDCSRGRGEAEATSAIRRAVGLALEDAGIGAEEIDVLSLAANGSVAGDRREAEALGAFFGERAARLPVMAVKGQIGECLGASGAFQTLALVEALAEGVVPGIAGLHEVDDGFPLALASRDNREAEMKRGLVHALGFDGNTSALVVEQW